jgi:phosphocarrier protein
MAEIEILINHKEGLHARPASLFVKKASAYPCEILVQNLSTNGPTVSAKSILNILTLGVNCGEKIKIKANGEKDQEALNELKKLIVSNFEN